MTREKVSGEVSLHQPMTAELLVVTGEKRDRSKAHATASGDNWGHFSKQGSRRGYQSNPQANKAFLVRKWFVSRQ